MSTIPSLPLNIDTPDIQLHEVREKFPGYFDCPDKVFPFVPPGPDEFSADDGFPEILDLSAVYSDAKLAGSFGPTKGKSVFAYAMAEKKGKPIDDRFSAPQKDSDDFLTENDRRLAKMTPEEVVMAREEIISRFDPTLVEFLKNRKNLAAQEEKSDKKVSAFRAGRLKKTDAPKPHEPESEPVTQKPKDDNESLMEDQVLQLEAFNIEEGANPAEQAEKFSRLAASAVQMDLTAKSYGLSAPRQANTWLSIFDKIRTIDIDKLFAKEPAHVSQILRDAIQYMDKIKEIYLEELQGPSGKIEPSFAPDINPATDGSWTFVPLRRVYEAIEDKRLPLPDDVEIVRLALVFSVAYFKCQPTLSTLFGSPSDSIVRLAEVFLCGPEVYTDPVVDSCVTVLLTDYFIPAGRQGKILLQAAKPAAGLDAFLPFFNDLLNEYEKFGGGYTNFGKLLFVMACLNASPVEQLTLLSNIYSPTRSLVRSMGLQATDVAVCIEHALASRKTVDYFANDFVIYSQVLAVYTHAAYLAGPSSALGSLARRELLGFVDFWTGSEHPEPSKTIEETVGAVSVAIKEIRNHDAAQ